MLLCGLLRSYTIQGLKFPTMANGWFVEALRNNSQLAHGADATAAGCRAQYSAMEQWRCLLFNESLGFVKTPLFVVQQIPATWTLQCELDGVPSGNILQIACNNHNASMAPLTKCVEYPDRCDPAVVRDYMVPLQQQLLREFAHSPIASLRTTGQFYHHCYLGSYWEEAAGTTNGTKVPRPVDSVWNQISIGGITMRQAIEAWWDSIEETTTPQRRRSLSSESSGNQLFLHADPPWNPNLKAPEYRRKWTGKGDPPVPWWTSRFMTNPSCRGYPVR